MKQKQKKMVKYNNAHRSCIIKWVVKVQCGISCAAAVLSHCRVLADRTKTELFSINKSSFIHVLAVNKSYKWANTEEDLAGPEISHMSNNTPAITQSQHRPLSSTHPYIHPLP